MAEPQPTEPARALLERARRFLPGGTIHTFSRRPAGFPTFMETPDFVVRPPPTDPGCGLPKASACSTSCSAAAASFWATRIRRSLPR